MEGTTSAYAEKSPHHIAQRRVRRNYLRIRGEEKEKTCNYQLLSELPPHTRRRANEYFHWVPVLGTTSAYAEKSRVATTRRTNPRNYLRIRGEELYMERKD